MCWRVVCCIRFLVFRWRCILCLGNIIGKGENLKNNYLREVPIAGILGNNKYSGYIDLLVKNTDHYLIVDYKTDTIDSKNTIDKKNEIYSNQLAIYSALLKKTFQTIRVRALFLFLNSPDIVEFEIQNLESIENEIIKSNLIHLLFT